MTSRRRPSRVGRRQPGVRTSARLRESFVMSSEVAGPLAAQAFEGVAACYALGRKGAVARPHSDRLSGVRFWFGLGASLQTIMCIRLCTDEKTLKHYLGPTLIARRLCSEITPETGNNNDRLTNLLQQLEVHLISLQQQRSIGKKNKRRRLRWSGRSPRASASEQGLVLVSNRHPRRLHKISSTHGASSV